MGSIFGTAATRSRTTRQRAYLEGKKTDRKQVKHEETMQLQLCQWLRDTFPQVHFRSDTGSGAFNSKLAKNTHNLQQSSDSLPDITIFSARRGYHALMLELKADGVELKMKRDGRTVRVTKRNGRVIERDYKIRKKGDWATLHIEKQASRMVELREAGYLAMFAVGLEKSKEIICWYFDVPYAKTVEMF